MAIPATSIGEIHTGGSDTTNGGWFDPGQTVGMATDGAATVANTASPVFASASYTFVAGDVGAYLYISPAATWIAGWYKIASVATGAATLSAAAGAAELKTGGLTTVAGCSTVASPTDATWAIDYSQQDAAQFTYTDLHGNGATFDLTSAAKPFTVAMVGNFLRVTGGTGFVAGIYYITTVVAGTATFGPGQPHTGAGDDADGTGGMGGALATDGMAGSEMIAGNKLWIKYNATPIINTSASSNVAAGRFTTPGSASVSNPVTIRGYDTVRGDQTANRPTLQCGVNMGNTARITTTGIGSAFMYLANLIIDCNRANFTGSGGVTFSAASSVVRRVKVMGANSTGGPFTFNAANNDVIDCEITDSTVAVAIGAQGGIRFLGCYVHDNTAAGFTISTGTANWDHCIIDTNGAAGISSTGAGFVNVMNCSIYGNTGAGIDFTAQPNRGDIINTALEANGDHGIKMAAAYSSVRTINCAFFNNTTAKYTGITTVLPYGHLSGYNVVGEVIPTASPFNNAASANFQLNSGAGVLLTATGFPPAFPGLSTPTNYQDIGAYGSQGVSGGTPFGAEFIRT